MRPRSRLKHAAAGLLGSLISRNNDVNGFWAMGLLSRDAILPPHRMEINFIDGSSSPASKNARLMAACYASFLRKAMSRINVDWDELTEATVSLQFNAQVPDPNFSFPCPGDPFVCTVTLRTSVGRSASVSAMGRCFPRPAEFSQSTGPNRERGKRSVPL